MKHLVVYFILLLSGFFLTAHKAEAVKVYPEVYSFFENEQKLYEVKIFINTEEENINAISGEVHYSENDLIFKKTIEGGSLINLWLNEPEKVAEGKISFSGGMPGGYKGEREFLLSIIFSTPENKSLINQTEIFFENFVVYLNDGKGSKLRIENSRNILNLEKAQEKKKIVDEKPPEIFAPYITNDLNLFAGQWFVVLNAQDKGEGISHYEIFESETKYQTEDVVNNKDLPWLTVSNPRAHILHNQELTNFIYVKAVDKQGNERVAMVFPANDKKINYFNYKIVSVIVIFLAVIIFSGIFFFKKILKTKTNQVQ